MSSVVQMIAHDTVNDAHILGGGALIEVGSGPNIADARNKIVRSFLASPAEWLLMVDTDMVFGPDLLDRLLAAADPEARPIVGGLCHGKAEHEDGVSYFPTIYYHTDKGSARASKYPADTLLEVHATGGACLLIHRTVMEKIGAEYPEPYPWFQEEVVEGRRCSEDVVFCIRAREQGFRVYVHTGIDVGHVKKEVVDAATYQAWRESNA